MTTNGRKKEHIKVFVLTGPETSGVVAHEYKKDGKTEHRGFALDVFREAIEEPSMKDKYTFDIEFMKDTGIINYDKIVQQVVDGKYDIAIGSFDNTPAREKIVDFTVPTKIDSTALFYIPEKSAHDVNIQTVKEIATIIGIALGLGLLMGILLVYLNPKRKGLHMKQHVRMSKKGFFYRTIMTTIASMFGEMGYLSENTTPNMKGLLIATFVMISAFLFVIFIQARLTTSMLEQKITRHLDPYSITRGTILGIEGYAEARRFEELGGTVKYMKNITNDQLMDMYLKNQDKYIGVALSYCDGYPYLQLHPKLHTSLHDNHISAFPVNESKIDFLNDLNVSIMSLASKDILTSLCKHYFGKIQNKDTPTCTLK